MGEGLSEMGGRRFVVHFVGSGSVLVIGSKVSDKRLRSALSLEGCKCLKTDVKCIARGIVREEVFPRVITCEQIR
jgi:hypothetical protein